jgi:hypothetical protein
MRAGSIKVLRHAAAAGGAAIVALGAASVYSTASGPHFEGYALVLGSMLVVQGLLTLMAFTGFPAGAAPTTAALTRGSDAESALAGRCPVCTPGSDPDPTPVRPRPGVDVISPACPSLLASASRS